MVKNLKPVVAGDPITFRLPVNTPKEVIEYLSELKLSGDLGKESSRLFLKAVKEKIEGIDKVTLILPGALSKEKQMWLESEETQRIFGQWIYQLLTQKTVAAPPIPGADTQRQEELHESTRNLLKGLGMDEE